MQAFTYHCPTEIVFGKDTQLQLAEQIRKYGELLSEEYTQDGIAVTAYVPAELYGQLV